MDLNLDLKLNVNTLRPLAGEGRKLLSKPTAAR